MTPRSRATLGDYADWAGGRQVVPTGVGGRLVRGRAMSGSRGAAEDALPAVPLAKVWHDEIAAALEGPDWARVNKVASRDVLRDVLGLDPEHLAPGGREYKAVITILTALGWGLRKVRLPGKRTVVRRWVRPVAAAPVVVVIDGKKSRDTQEQLQRAIHLARRHEAQRELVPGSQPGPVTLTEESQATLRWEIGA